jgi:glyoxylase-like metal-dependent hydrolase (beta-lactamase superfamily II)
MVMPLTLAPTDRTLSAHVTVLTGAERGKYPDGNSVLIVGTEGVALIDPSLTVHRRRAAPADVDQILISHAHEDHMSGITVIGGAVIRAHHRDLQCVHHIDRLVASYEMSPADTAGWRATLVADFHLQDRPHAVGFGDGDVFDLGGVTVTVLHLPGHTAGHSAFLIEPDGLAFVGDIDLSGFGPYYGDHWSDLDEFVDSLARVRDLQARHYITFHHKGVVDGHAEFVRQLDVFAAVIDRRDDKLLGMLQQPRTLDELAAIGIIYRHGDQPSGWGSSVERRSISMHLRRLMAAGAVQTDGDRFWRGP